VLRWQPVRSTVRERSIDEAVTKLTLGLDIVAGLMKYVNAY
jgi:hypothetical protein